MLTVLTMLTVQRERERERDMSSSRTVDPPMPMSIQYIPQQQHNITPLMRASSRARIAQICSTVCPLCNQRSACGVRQGQSLIDVVNADRRFWAVENHTDSQTLSSTSISHNHPSYKHPLHSIHPSTPRTTRLQHLF
jgi:hypothetical protein